MDKGIVGDSKLFDIQNLVDHAQWSLLRCCGGADSIERICGKMCAIDGGDSMHQRNMGGSTSN